MHENFADGALEAVQFADKEARQFHHDSIGTEHLLLGLINVRNGTAVKVLHNLGVELPDIRRHVQKSIDPKQVVSTVASLEFTSGAKKAIDHAKDEAQQLSHEFVDTDHILLGLLREGEGIAAQVLTRLGLKLEEVREEILHVLKHSH